MKTASDGDARLHPFGSKTGTNATKIALTFLVANLLATFAKAILAPEFAGPIPVDIDFRVFWSAAQSALQGNPLAAFDPEASILDPEARAAGGAQNLLLWLYPPGYLLVLMPFGFVPFVPAWALFDALSLVAIAFALRPFTRTEPSALRLMIAAPAFLPALWLGQNSLFWLAGLLGALACIRDGRMIVAGLLIGLLTLKPQLGLLIPIALVAAGHWRTILAACVSAVVVALIPTLIFGMAYWSELASILETFGSMLRANVAEETLMCSTFGVLSWLGVNPDTALAVQWGVMAVAALAVWRAWRNPEIGFDLKAATLLAAIPAATPYLWHYDTAFLAATGLFLMRAGVIGFGSAGLAAFGLFWLGAGPWLLVVNLFGDGAQVPVGLLVTPLILVALGLCIAAPFRSSLRVRAS